jgi:hypothetical protein
MENDLFTWKLSCRSLPLHSSLCSHSFSLSDDIIQGSLGNCWFLSAVAVLCDRPDLLDHVIGQNPILSSDHGQIFRFFASGEWKEIIVDSYLPCHPITDTTNKKRKISPSRQGPLLIYSHAKKSQLWVSLLEKAYAKLYSCYEALHGGHIPEALFDLTGCPCESIHINLANFDSEETWFKLMSYRSLDFPMGCSTDFSGEGIVGNHAYSLLDIRELRDIQLGEQLSIRTFFTTSSSSSLDPLSVPSFSSSSTSTSEAQSPEEECLSEVQMTGQLRLLRIRNPWGKTEWKGNFSSHSTLWTAKLKKLLSETSSRSNSSCSVDTTDGSFWITYTDFLRRFVTIDICKAHSQTHPAPSSSASLSLPLSALSLPPPPSWKIHCVDDTIGAHELSTTSSFLLTIHSTSASSPSLYLTLLQESKRGSYASSELSKRSYYYSDLTVIIRRHSPNQPHHGAIVAASFTAPMRSTCPLELSLSSGIYLIQVMKFSPVLLAPPRTHSSPAALKGAYLRHNQRYWLHLYSSQSLEVQKCDPSVSSSSSTPFPFISPVMNLMSYLDDLTSPLSQLPPHSRPILSRLCSTSPSPSSSSTYQTPLLDAYVLRGNGVNLLFCRARCSVRNGQATNRTKTKGESFAPSSPVVMELVTIKTTDTITILSPFLISQSIPSPSVARTGNPLPPPAQDLTHLMATFKFLELKENELKVLGVIFHSKGGGSDSFEFIGDLYLHPSASVLNYTSSPPLPQWSSWCETGGAVRDWNEFGSYWRPFDCVREGDRDLHDSEEGQERC